MEKKNKNQQIVIKICCVIASFVLWLYIFNVENPIRERKITVPVQVVNKAALSQFKLVPVNADNLSVTLNIRGNASDVYSVKASDFNLESDLSAYALRKGQNRIPITIKKKPESITIVNNENLWVAINLDTLVEKYVPVKIALEGNVKDGFYAMQPIVNFKKVQIKGPEGSVASVSDVEARCNIKEAYKDVNTVASLQAEDISGMIIKNVQLNPSSVQVKVPIEKIKSVPINVKTQGSLPNGGVLTSIVPMPEKVDIVGTEGILSKTNSLDTENIDLSKVDGKDVLEVKLIVPSGITFVNSNGIIKVQISVDKGIQKNFNLDIQTKNVGSNYTATVDTSKASITLSGLESNLSNLNPNNVTSFVDLNNLTEGNHDVPVIINTPSGITVVSQNPKSVKVTIKKKSGG
jgi:YbbR domain-containing protein